MQHGKNYETQEFRRRDLIIAKIIKRTSAHLHQDVNNHLPALRYNLDAFSKETMEMVEVETKPKPGEIPNF